MSKTQTIHNDQFYCQVPGNIVSDMDGEKVMLNIEKGKYYNLGQLGGDIWELLKSPIKVETLVTTLLSQYNVDRDQCAEQVSTFLNQLLEQGLVKVEVGA